MAADFKSSARFVRAGSFAPMIYASGKAWCIFAVRLSCDYAPYV